MLVLFFFWACIVSVVFWTTDMDINCLVVSFVKVLEVVVPGDRWIVLGSVGPSKVADIDLDVEVRKIQAHGKPLT